MAMAKIGVIERFNRENFDVWSIQIESCLVD
jgi:hypothetical protein